MTAVDPAAERNARAHQYLQEGRDDLAIPLFEEVLAERVRVLGADHPDTIACLNNLAGAYESAWCLGKAISQYKKVLAHQLRVLGRRPPPHSRLPQQPRSRNARPRVGQRLSSRSGGGVTTAFPSGARAPLTRC